MVTMSFFFSFFITYLSNVSCFIHIKPISIESPGVTRLLRDSGTTLGSVYTMPEVAFQESKLRGGNRSLSEHARLTLYIWIFFLGLGRTPSPICINKKAKNKTKHPPQISSHYKPIYYKPITMDCTITNSNEKILKYIYFLVNEKVKDRLAVSCCLRKSFWLLGTLHDLYYSRKWMCIYYVYIHVCWPTNDRVVTSIKIQSTSLCSLLDS